MYIHIPSRDLELILLMVYSGLQIRSRLLSAFLLRTTCFFQAQLGGLEEEKPAKAEEAPSAWVERLVSAVHLHLSYTFVGFWATSKLPFSTKKLLVDYHLAQKGSYHTTIQKSMYRSPRGH